MTAKEGLRIAMEKKERQFKSETEALEFQVFKSFILGTWRVLFTDWKIDPWTGLLSKEDKFWKKLWCCVRGGV